MMTDEFERVVFGVVEEDSFGSHVGEFGYGGIEVEFF